MYLLTLSNNGLMTPDRIGTEFIVMLNFPKPIFEMRYANIYSTK